MTRKLPQVKKPKHKLKNNLPYDRESITDGDFSFSFNLLDRNHELFNMGIKSETKEGTIDSSWFLDLFDCLKDVSCKKFIELQNPVNDLHPVNWNTANAKKPEINNLDNDIDFWQFRISKSKGRIIGIYISNVFYIIWLDAYHNLTNSEGYEGIIYCGRPKSIFEKREEELKNLKSEVSRLQEENAFFDGICDTCERITP